MIRLKAELTVLSDGSSGAFNSALISILCLAVVRHGVGGDEGTGGDVSVSG